VYLGDVAVSEDVESLLTSAREAHGPIDAIVHCAGTLGFPNRLGDSDFDSWNAVIQTNLLGTFNLLNIGKSFLWESGGLFVGLSGGGATAPMPGLSAYAASKAAAVRLMETAAMEFSEGDVQVVAVAPGVMLTNMISETLEANPAALDPDYLARMQKTRASGENHIGDAAGLVLELIANKTLARACSGRLISAVWDDWRGWSTQAGGPVFDDAEMRLRRIIK
jgi:NAD(P)-dependent dehydrogenase (short-subunit alcohol dehydrogenase family)